MVLPHPIYRNQRSQHARDRIRARTQSQSQSKSQSQPGGSNQSQPAHQELRSQEETDQGEEKNKSHDGSNIDGELKGRRILRFLFGYIC